MGFNVRVLPSGRSFRVEPHEPILEAALRAGLDLSYNCASGTCGECRARVVSGSVEVVRFHDYAFSEAQKQQGYVLLCSTGAAGDLVIEVDETPDPAAVPEQRINAKVYRVETVGDSHLLLSVRTPRSKTLRFLAGQAVELSFPDGPARRLAVGSCPCNGMILQFHLARQPEDPFSDYVFSQAHHGQPVGIRGPYGHFTLNEQSQRPIEMLAWDTGFAPIKSVLEHAVQLEKPQPKRLFWVAQQPGGHYLANYCRSLADALEDFRFVPLVAGEGDVLGRVLATVAHPEQADWYVAGSGEFVLFAKQRLFGAGVPREQIFTYGE
jgi:CDP-4-dehydro-6-deoxyglucose reductase